MMVQHDLVDDSKAAMVICLPESKPCKMLRMSEILKKVGTSTRELFTGAGAITGSLSYQLVDSVVKLDVLQLTIRAAISDKLI